MSSDKENPVDKQATANLLPDRPLTEVGFATVVLRLLGVYFAAFGFVGLLDLLGHTLVQGQKLGFEHMLDHYTPDYFVHPAAELLIGFYFLVGGQWIFDKLLTPLPRDVDDDFEDDEEIDNAAEERKSDEASDAKT